MYATIRSYSGGDLADVLVAREDEIKQVIGSIDGFRSYQAVRTADGTTTISVFDDQAGAEASTSAAAGWISENLPDASFGAPEVKTGEVAVTSRGLRPRSENCCPNRRGPCCGPPRSRHSPRAKKSPALAGDFLWARLDSNQGPTDYESAALTS